MYHGHQITHPAHRSIQNLYIGLLVQQVFIRADLRYCIYGLLYVWTGRIMCNGVSANNTINSCNSNDCAAFLESHGQSGRILIDQPGIWTENEGWFTSVRRKISYHNICTTVLLHSQQLSRERGQRVESSR